MLKFLYLIGTEKMDNYNALTTQQKIALHLEATNKNIEENFKASMVNAAKEMSIHLGIGLEFCTSIIDEAVADQAAAMWEGRSWQKGLLFGATNQNMEERIMAEIIINGSKK